MLVGLAGAADLTNARWYTIKVGNGGYLSTKSTYRDGVYLLLSKTLADTDDTGLWTFIGNETDGYSFYNKARGENYVIGMKGTEDQGRAQMVKESNISILRNLCYSHLQLEHLSLPILIAMLFLVLL